MRLSVKARTEVSHTHCQNSRAIVQVLRSLHFDTSPPNITRNVMSIVNNYQNGRSGREWYHSLIAANDRLGDNKLNDTVLASLVICHCHRDVRPFLHGDPQDVFDQLRTMTGKPNSESNPRGGTTIGGHTSARPTGTPPATNNPNSQTRAPARPAPAQGRAAVAETTETVDAMTSK